jgi:cysteine desulfurase
VASLPVDMLSLAAQNFYGPKGVAALYVRKGVRIQPQLEGGVQENNRRAGTENVPGIVGMGQAAELAAAEMTERSGKLMQLRDRLLQELPKRLERVYISGHPTERLPGHASFCLEFVEGEGMLLFLEDAGIATASVSACTSKTLRESYVLIAMGYDHALAQGSLILTLGPENTMLEVEHFLDALPPIVERLRRMSPLYARYQKNPAAYEAAKTSAAFCEPDEHDIASSESEVQSSNKGTRP